MLVDSVKFILGFLCRLVYTNNAQAVDEGGGRRGSATLACRWRARRRNEKRLGLEPMGVEQLRDARAAAAPQRGAPTPQEVPRRRAVSP